MKNKEELLKELKTAKRKLTDLPLDCTDRQWERREKLVKDLEEKLLKFNK